MPQHPRWHTQLASLPISTLLCTLACASPQPSPTAMHASSPGGPPTSSPVPPAPTQPARPSTAAGAAPIHGKPAPTAVASATSDSGLSRPAPIPAPSTAQHRDEPARSNASDCDTDELFRLEETPKPLLEFSVHGYLARKLRISREFPDGTREHCITVAWPAGGRNHSGKKCSTYKHIDGAWLRAIENTLARVPWSHATLVERVIIDNHPSEHGVAPFDRHLDTDGRDGHSIWLSEHLFRAPNHWANGNYGTYWGYHCSVNGVAFDNAPAEHPWFSPILLHELGHLVMYSLVNASLPELDASNPPPCAITCAERGDCAQLTPAERERGCISAYCRPFRYAVSTENWAEQYRLYYQSAVSRDVLGRANASCLEVLRQHDVDSSNPTLPPWERGLADIPTFERTRWNSCGKKACKAW